LQIRADKRKLDKKELIKIQKNIEDIIENLIIKGNRGLFITDIAKEHGGIDFYISEKGSALTIAKIIQDQYGGEIKQSSTNIGMKDSKQVYRMTYLVRLPAFRKDDFISYNNSFFYISSINKNKAHLIKLKDWSEHVFDIKNIKNAKILGGSDLIKEMIFVSQSKDEIQLMNSKNYKTFDLIKPINISFNNKLIRVVSFDGNMFLFPEKNTIDK